MGLTYYVDGAHPDASDTNTGDADHPFLTIRRGLDVLHAGEVLTVRPGIYRERLGEVTLKGTADAPILIQAEPGVIVRPTTCPTVPITSVDADHNVWSLPTGTSARILETDESNWEPIPVADPNGVHFDLSRPMPTHPVDRLDLVYDVVGSNYFDADAGLLYFRPYWSKDHGVELLTGQKVSFRGAYVTVTGFAFDYFSCLQVYSADHYNLGQLHLCGSPFELNSTTQACASEILVEQVIKRGDTYEWHHSGSGQAIAVKDTCRHTLLSQLTARHSWNGASFGGDFTTVEGATLYGFPNHNFGVAGHDGIYTHVKAYQSQDSLFAQYGSRCTIAHCDLERAMVIGGGHTILGKAMTDLVLTDNTMHGGGLNCSNDTTIAESDRNYFITNYWDYRYQDQECDALDKVRERFGLELHSVWDNRMLPR